MDTETVINAHYVNHLANVNNKKKVVATENIYNQFGALLVPKGTAIEHRVHDFLVGHKMKKQLDEFITVDGCLTANSLVAEFNKLLALFPDLQQIHQCIDFGQMLEHLCSVQQIPRILLQKLTILKLQLPTIFEQTLFSTWLGCMLAKEMKLSPQHIRNTFYVGLLHDLGLLHIDPELISKQGSYSDQEWHSVKHHMMISVAIAKLIYPFDEEVYRGIKEHHERCDGTGYPKELRNEQLSYSGQLIGLADIICHIRTRQYQQSGKSMANIMPYIQINQHSFKYESYQAMYTLVQRAELEISDLLNRKDFLALPKRLILQRVRITQLHLAFADFVALFPKETKGKHSKALIESCEHIGDTIKRAGLNSPETLDWLESISDSDFNDARQELQELDSMHYELLWQFKKVFRIIPDFLQEELPAKAKLAPQLNAHAETMQQNLLQAWTDYQ
ncbi:hypothetical protein tinsulaeT_00730 [Thalassotalea insulae]|uniref:HD-GYP domain-containing protein n=1 Tax=Thalassotalea insulae TaxID=2056778 RepID=A0ABQ6GL36_9GAMM|nr:HD domain-containing phosphohydrolase [Thalassotalea insulae]GLX76733.1 hypothetical protein tinsulaeT_00730 [Thalassotalea insulae]